MKRYAILLATFAAALPVAQVALGQPDRPASSPSAALRVNSVERAGRGEPQQLSRRYQDMSEAEREKFRAELEQRRRQYENMSPEEREKFRAEMRERFGTRPGIMGQEEQLEVIAAMQKELDKLKAAVERMDPDARNRLRDLPEAERDKLRQEIAAAMRDRVEAVRAIEQELDKLRFPGRSAPETRPGIGELRAIHELAVKEEAAETAKSIESLMARYGVRPPGRGLPGPPRPRGDRPPRPERPGPADAGARAKPFTLQTFDGKTVSLADYRGKTVVLEWLNTECPFSMHHYDKAHTMIDLADKYKDKGIVWLAINSTSHTTPADNQAFAAKHKLPYALLDDRSGQVGRAYGAKTTPHVFVISPNGGIVYDGAIDNSPLGKTAAGQEPVNYVDKVLADVTAGRDVSVKNTKPYGCSVKYAQ